MSTHSRRLATGLLATLLMSVAVSSARANRLSITNARIRATWSTLRFLNEEGADRWSCPLTIEGSFHSATIRKIRGALIGYVTNAAVNSGGCTGVGVTVLHESLPWHVTYDSFTGALPAITGVKFLLHNVAFRVELFGLPCVYATDAAHRAVGTFDVSPGGGANTVTIDNTIRLLRSGGSMLCPSSVGLEGVGQVSLLGNTSRISITLI